MRLDVFSVDEFVSVNKLEEVKDPILFNQGGIPSEEGLFSPRIFGRIGSDSRKYTFAYIDLGDYFFHPIMYKNLIRMNRKFESCIMGSEYYILKNGELEKVEDDDPNGDTGITFLYKNWEKIKWSYTESTMRKERVDLVKGLKKTEIFLSKWIVIPCFYRDVNYNNMDKGKLAHDEINDFYTKLIRLSHALKTTSGISMNFISNNTKSNIQKVLNDIYDYCTGKIEKKDGLFRKSVLGKAVDLSGRGVISAPKMNMDHYKDMKVNFDHTGVPLGVCGCLFAPFFTKWIQDFIRREFTYKNTIDKFNDKGVFERSIKLLNPLDDYDYNKIIKKIDRFYNTPHERFDILKINTEEGYLPLNYYGRIKTEEGKSENTLYNRNLTWTDIIFMAAKDITKDKHVYITRYPITDYLSIYPTRISVLSTFNTETQIINGIEYNDYPKIDLSIEKEKIPNLFVDSIQLMNSFLPAIGGDYDGDMVTLRGLFTQEANEEAERKINSTANILDIVGKNIRTVSAEGLQTFYDLTK